MEEAVPAHVVPHGLESKWRNLCRAHVVPLHDLVEQNAVQEATEAEAQEDAGLAASGSCGRWRHLVLPNKKAASSAEAAV
jgi:hypothetical protein